MGRRGPLPQQRDREGKVIPPQQALANLAPPNPALADVPPAPPGLLPAVRVLWHDFWTSRAANWVDRGAHMGRLVRWIRDVDQYHRVLADLRPRRGQVDAEGAAVASTVPGVIDSTRPWLGRGSMRQLTAHPNTALLAELDQRIHRAEVEFGMTPYAAVRLAGAGVQGALTAHQLARMLEQRGKAQPDDEEAQPWAAGLQPPPT